MLHFNVAWVDVTANIASGVMPVHLLEMAPMHAEPKAWGGPSEIAREGTYYSPQMDCFQEDPMWVKTAIGTHVRVPMSAYRTSARTLEALWGLGLQVGMLMMESFKTRIAIVPESVTLVLGTQCTDLGLENAIRAYVGLAIKTANY